MRRIMLIALLATATATVTAATAPPTAPVRPVTDSYFGTPIVDNYRYFENLKDPAVQAWMKAQADYTRSVLDAIPGRAALLQWARELEASQPVTVHDVQIVAGRYYSIRTPASAQTGKLYVRQGLDGDDQMLLDPEPLGRQRGSHVILYNYSPSPDGRYVAYTLSAGGSEQLELHILDVHKGADVDGMLDRAGWDPRHWLPDGSGFFYTRFKAMKSGMPPTEKYRDARVFLHRLGHPFKNDMPLFGRGLHGSVALQPDDMPNAYSPPDSHFVLMEMLHGTAPTMRVYAASREDVIHQRAHWRAIAPDHSNAFVVGDEESLDPVHGDSLYWISRKDSPNGAIMRLDLADPQSRPEIAVAAGELPISEMYAAGDALYWRVSDAGMNTLYRRAYSADAKTQALPSPYPANIASVAADSLGPGVIVRTTSWTRSDNYLAGSAGDAHLQRTTMQPAGPLDVADNMTVEEVKVRSWDGTRVPLSIMYRKDLVRDGNAPTLITGYGAYGYVDTANYSPVLRSLTERGVVLAIAHVRGGGEYGERWHKAGFQQNKPNTWKDFIACAQYLVDRHYTRPARLAGMGGSAGGILIGRAIEERPDLFTAAVALAPFADTLRFETTATGPANVAEFGSTKTPQGFRSLLAMSPYANVKDGAHYPAILIATGVNDPRVAPWESAKWAARLQAATSSGKPVLLRVDYDGGHGNLGAANEQRLALSTDWISFALWQAGVPDFQPLR